jgi:Ca-activated chloride channel family protein
MPRWQGSWLAKGVSRGLAVLTVGLVMGLAPARPARVLANDGQGAKPTFKASVDLVSLTAVVRDRRGQIIRNLSREDFEIFDAGVPRPIVEFAPAEDGPVSLAILFDTSGSMGLSRNLEHGVALAEQVLGLLRPAMDEVAVYAFDSGLREMQGFTTDLETIRRTYRSLDAYGTTALYDAIGTVASRLDERPHRRRALVVVTDGLDTASRRSAAEVAGVASASDVPVYVVIVGPEAADEVREARTGFQAEAAGPFGHLGNLAYWTGGAFYAGRGPAAASVAARAILAELRHQYLLAFESAGPGWRPVDVRLRRRELTVRARSAYQATPRPVS